MIIPHITIFENEAYVPKILNIKFDVMVNVYKLIFELLQVEEFNIYFGVDPTIENVEMFVNVVLQEEHSYNEPEVKVVLQLS